MSLDHRLLSWYPSPESIINTDTAGMFALPPSADRLRALRPTERRQAWGVEVRGGGVHPLGGMQLRKVICDNPMVTLRQAHLALPHTGLKYLRSSEVKQGALRAEIPPKLGRGTAEGLRE